MPIRYSELYDFFSKDKFTAEELSTFIDKTSSKLSEKERDLLLILVNNQLSKFAKKNFNGVKNDSITTTKINDTKDLKIPITSSKKSKTKEKVKDLTYLFDFVNLSTEELADKLQISLKLLKNVFIKHDINFEGIDKLNIAQLTQIEPYIYERMRFVKPKAIINVKRFKKPTNNLNDTYGKFLKYGMSKIIYIRMK